MSSRITVSHSNSYLRHPCCKAATSCTRSNAAWRSAVRPARFGLVALVYPPAELAIAGGAVVALTLAGAGFGAWTATMIGVDEPNARLERFRGAIRDGQLLIMADVPGSREHEIEQMVAQHFPKADLEGAEPTTLIFP